MTSTRDAGLRIASTRVVWGGHAAALEVTPGWVEIRGPTIAATGRTQPPSRTSGISTIDFGDHLISPAFVNAHSHLALGFLRGRDLASADGNLVAESMFAAEEGLSADDVRAFARMGAFESLLQGVGLVWDHYYHGSAIAEALIDTGLCGVVAPTLQDIAGPGRQDADLQMQATRDIAASARLAAHGVFAAIGPHATDTVSARLWRQATELAAELDLPLHFHLAQSLGELEHCVQATGLSPAAWLQREGFLDGGSSNLMAHGLFLSRSDLRLLDGRRDTLVYCPYSQLVFAFPAAVGVWLEEQMPFVVATDCSSTNDSFNLQKELRFLAGQRTVALSTTEAYGDFLESGAPAAAARAWRERASMFRRHESVATTDDLLRRVWSVPGRLHPSFRVGAIETGALANLAIWDLHHPSFWPDATGLRTLAMGDTTQAIHALVVGGRLIGEIGDFHRSVSGSAAYRAAREEADGRLRRLC